MKIHAIAAMTSTDVIGDNNAIPWNIPTEQKMFRQKTLNKTVIMGYKTWCSLEKPLAQRNNIVICDQDIELPGAKVAPSPSAALKLAEELGQEVYVIGGGEIFKQLLPQVDQLDISHIKQEYPGTIKFPQVDWDKWQETSSEDHEEFTAKTYQRIK